MVLTEARWVGRGCGWRQSERFIIPQAKRAYIQQYAQLYFTRLKLLEKRVRAALDAQAPTAKGNDVRCTPESCVMGTGLGVVTSVG